MMASGTASRDRRALFSAEEAAARVLCDESSDDDLDDLFTLEDLQEDISEEDYLSGGDDVSDSLEKESSVHCFVWWDAVRQICYLVASTKAFQDGQALGVRD